MIRHAELILERKIATRQRAVEIARRRWARELMRLIETIHAGDRPSLRDAPGSITEKIK